MVIPMNNKRITMSAIAAAAGVSQSTVSLVLNGSTTIKLADETRRRELEKAVELGYQHKRAEHLPRGPSARKIAFVFNGHTSYDPFLDAINACNERAWEADRMLVTFDYRNSAELTRLIEQEINQGDYLGMIFASSMTRQLAEMELSPQVPTVLLNCYLEATSLPERYSILPADKLAGYKVTAHLLDQGCKRVALIQGEPWMEANSLRLEGYRQALINHDLIPEPQWVRVGNWSLHEAYEQTRQLLALPQPPDGIFCCSDYMAQGCYQAIAEAGLRIPEDILVAGHDNQMLASEMEPPLSSIELPYDEMGKQAVDTLLQLAQGEKPIALQMKLEGELLIRASTRGRPVNRL